MTDTPPSLTTRNPETRNPDWGFFGTIRHHADPAAAWPLALAAITTATGCTDEQVRAFLDSRDGRHFADDASNGIARHQDLATAIAEATRRWMGWRIGAHTARVTGIPRGLPYLTGFVLNAAIAAETQD